MIGKNVGIKRARGEFVLATNIDILFSDQLVKFLSDGNFSRGYSYRVDRKDVDFSVSENGYQPDILKRCQKKVIRINKKFGTYPYGNLREKWASIFLHQKDHQFRNLEFRQYGYPTIHTNACGDFTLLARKDWEDLHGYPEYRCIHSISTACCSLPLTTRGSPKFA